MRSLSSPYSGQARRNYLSHRISQAVILALFIFGVTATSSGEGEPNTSVAPSSQTLDPAFSEGHSIPSGVIIEPIEAILDDRNAQEPFKAATPSSGSKMAYESPVLAPETTGEPDINDSVVSSNGDPVKTIEIDGDSCPDGYEELLDEEEPVLEEEKTAVAVEEADREATGTSVSGVEQAVEKNATNHSPVINDVPIDPLDRSFIETVQEVVAESNPSEVKETLEDFLAELFQESEGESSAASVQTPEGQKPKILTEEEIAEQKRRLEIETREKRIEITGRHAQWEQRLEERGKEVLAELLNQVKELRAYVSDDVENNEEISKLLSGYENEAAKAIKGVEAFFEKRIKIGKKVEESVVKTWEEVLRKVEKKVQDKKHEVDKEMQEYYNSYIDDELKYIDAAAKRVESVADDAQADLGMDYAWLEDVTVSDWTRYHDLTRTAKRWGDIYQSIFNSTHPELSSNEVVFALQNFQATLRDIGLGFDHVLRDLQRKAERIFKGDHDTEEIPGLGEEGVVTPVAEAEEKASQSGEEVPALGVRDGPTIATPAVHHEEL